MVNPRSGITPKGTLGKVVPRHVTCILSGLMLVVISCGNGSSNNDDCPGGQKICGLECVDVNSDPVHCGECDLVCEVNNGVPGCSNGSCSVLSCAYPFSDCDNSYENGCETSLATASDCGGCGLVCNGPPKTNMMCNDGLCQIESCKEGYGHCIGSPEDFETLGCETQLNTSEHCGECDHSCLDSEQCIDGACE